jgi:hypothetical protein
VTHRTALYGPVCRVVWEGGAARRLPIPIGGKVYSPQPPVTALTTLPRLKAWNQSTSAVDFQLTFLISGDPCHPLNPFYSATPQSPESCARFAHLAARLSDPRSC